MFFKRKKESEVTQLCPTLCDPMGCSLPGSSVHEIFQARVLEWIAISFSWGFSQTRNRTWVSRIAASRFIIWATRENLVPNTGLNPNDYLMEASQIWRWTDRAKLLKFVNLSFLTFESGGPFFASAMF